MATATGQPGRDYIFNITVKDSAGATQDLTTLTGYALVAYTDEDKVVCQWSKNAIQGYDDIVVVDESVGQVKILLPRDKTTALDNKTIYIECISQSDDGDFGDVQFGNLDGAKYELIKFTSSARAKVPDLSIPIS